MRPKSVALSLATGLLLGLLLGLAAGIVVHKPRAGARSFEKEFADSELAATHITVAVLSALQKGDRHEATQILEASLSLNAITLHEFLTTVRPDERISKTLVRIAEYRDRYPFSSGSSEGDNAVNEILVHALRGDTSRN